MVIYGSIGSPMWTKFGRIYLLWTSFSNRLADIHWKCYRDTADLLNSYCISGIGQYHEICTFITGRKDALRQGRVPNAKIEGSKDIPQKTKNKRWNVIRTWRCIFTFLHCPSHLKLQFEWFTWYMISADFQHKNSRTFQDKMENSRTFPNAS